MGISAEQWGRQAWHLIHTIALTYPYEPTEQDKKHYLDFINALSNVLPCPICADHFKDNIVKIPPRMETTKDFFEWTVDIHNEVNKSNNKTVLTYEEALEELYKNMNVDKFFKKSATEVNLLINRFKKIKQ